VPQARCIVMPGVAGDRPELSVASRPMFQSLLCLSDGAHGDFAQHLAVQLEFLDHGAQRLDRHAEVADVVVGRVVAAEGDADAADDGDTTDRRHRVHSLR